MHKSTILCFIFVLFVAIGLSEHNEADYDAWKDMQVACGHNKVQSARVVGGSEATKGEFPWMVILRKKKMVICSGVLISKRLVITIAHGISRHRYSPNLNVVVGAFNKDELNNDKAVQVLDVEDVWVHADFSLKSLQNDVALIRLSNPGVYWTGWVQPICLPPQGTSYVGRSAVVIGWGSTETGGQTMPKLHKAMIDIFPVDRCTRTYYPVKNITDASHICGGTELGDRDACQGDSGGPLMIKDERSRWNLIGIVSMGKLCGDRTAPGVYTNVSTYVNTIKDYVLLNLNNSTDF